VKQWCWNWTNWKRQNIFNSNVLSTNLQEPVPDGKLAQDWYEQWLCPQNDTSA
jgi:hypothetical protein